MDWSKCNNPSWCYTIDKGAIIAAGAVVTNAVEAFTIVGCVPAKRIKKM